MNTKIIFFILCILVCLSLFNMYNPNSYTHERNPDIFRFIGLIILILFIYIVISGFTSLFYKKSTPKQNKQTEPDMFNFFSTNY